ncbi:MAG TPA: NUDIX hydrolase [Stellaceae bacterium]|nr:NUDIX hydrolase [Stellaceae bacterium]
MSNRKAVTQYAALPFVLRNGQPRVMLVTSRGKRRWIIPKGWPAKNLTPHACAAKEAYEEAGIVGKIAENPLGTYRYKKRLRSGAKAIFEVEAYLLEVEHQLKDWPEKGQRVTRWMVPARAARLVGEDGLVELLLSLDGARARRGRAARVAGIEGVLAGLRAGLARFGEFWQRPKRRA